MEQALFTGTTSSNQSIRISQGVKQSSHHLIDPIFTEALLRISTYLPEWEVELINDSETWPDYMAEIVSLPVKHIWVDLKKGTKFVTLAKNQSLKLN